MCKEFALLFVGESVHHSGPLSKTEIAKKMEIDRKTVRKYLNIAADKYGFLKKENGKIINPYLYLFHKFTKRHKITSDKLVAEWLEDLLTRKAGEPIVKWKSRLSDLTRVCNTCEITPSQLLFSQRRTEKIMKKYAVLYKQGKHSRDMRGSASGSSSGIYHTVQAVRDFCGYYGITWRRGVGGIMSQRIVNHGKYADIRFSEDELEKADSFIKERWGLDSDVYRWFWIGIESCARFEALYSMNLDYTKHVSQKTGSTTYIMTAYESKTKQIRGGKWYKYITRKDTQSSIDLARKRGLSFIHESNMDRRNFISYISRSLREIYRHLGRFGDYFYNKPTHVLRHVGAHYWLAKKSYNYGLVAEIGGWHTIDELKKSYGQIPPEKILEIIES
ncbi:MAG: helix-turn-helix domain-containing protein [Nitrosopumilaceae archaeon]|nr:helix-turn-helix domain-containing protein [Nitrosopumilaceae archaeon]NIU01026.1 helix-turn-helix domain-containing protein [Nitrosopumilaceae archaeon]NIU87460.1 helix-turn-helix domain-containing protein [Nitrosopumilaceae archaeon]NIV65509.1 helix-turn-helix domain-containing protein [Nitrosopumilaceae archaeon]NIX61628.1 helix-turn-helix domain-containing protein [Nitrosopumilaceae archaeon]